MLDAHRHRTAAQTKRTEEDAEVNVFRFADVLGPNFTKENCRSSPLSSTASAIRDPRLLAPPRITGIARGLSKPARAFTASPGLKEGVANKDGTYNASYTSGHSTFGATCAIILGDMVPEKRAELFARAGSSGRTA